MVRWSADSLWPVRFELHGALVRLWHNVAKETAAPFNYPYCPIASKLYETEAPLESVSNGDFSQNGQYLLCRRLFLPFPFSLTIPFLFYLPCLHCDNAVLPHIYWREVANGVTIGRVGIGMAAFMQLGGQQLTSRFYVLSACAWKLQLNWTNSVMLLFAWGWTNS